MKPGSLKNYPHFDRKISVSAAEALANDPARVATHKFYPFIRYSKRWTRYANKDKSGKPKERPIRYAARADAYIFARYRWMLLQKYELELARLGLSDCVLAYRRIPTSDGHGGKCNIHFAKDAFDEVKRQGDCCVVALDISSFFENLDHDRLKVLWRRLLNVERLPEDHFKVFERITRYAFVDKEAVYERLGHYGVKSTAPSAAPINGYLTPKAKIPTQLCQGHEFQAKVAGGHGQQSIIQSNVESYGIPQGAPISDLLANLYLIDFDVAARDIAGSLGGKYFRYSDDILIIAPIDGESALALEARIRALIVSFGRKLRIKEEKSSVIRFKHGADRQIFEVVFDGQSRSEVMKRKQNELFEDRVDPASALWASEMKEASENGRKTLNGLEYLGFRFDGKSIYLRDSTLSNFWRKVTRATRGRARSCVRRYPNCDAIKIKSKFNYEDLIQNFGRVEDFGELAEDYRNWTFWTYVRHAVKIFGPGNLIMGQLRGHRRRIKEMADRQIDAAVSARSK
jgi:hypothetical protein